jgi:hypothetical protein
MNSASRFSGSDIHRSQQSVVVAPEIRDVLQAPETIERKLIVGCYQSFFFYRRIREIICPILDPKTGVLRPDFSVASYNKIYASINSMFRMWDHIMPQKDFGIRPEQFENYLVDRVKRGFLTKDDALSLLKEIVDESSQMVLPEEELRELPNSHVFRAWLEHRVISNEIKQLSNAQMLRVPTRADLVAASQRVDRSLEAGRSNAVNAGAVLLGSSAYMRPIGTEIGDLNAVLGGGFRLGDTTCVCGTTGGGKTVLAMQLATWFARNKLNTVIITTEQPPEQLIVRAVSNYIDYSFAEFLNRRDVGDANGNLDEILTIKNIPEFLWTDPTYGPRMHAFYDLMMNHLFIIDWSKGQGNSISGNLDNDINALALLGWDPRVVLVDWIGGGLAAETNQKDLRLIYKEAAEAIIRHGKQHKRCMFFFAQADKNLAKETTKAVTVKMLAECKSMADNASTFVGISALREAEQLQGTKVRLMRRQYLNVDKSRHGTGGLVAVEQCFNVQRFQNFRNNLAGGDQ